MLSLVYAGFCSSAEARTVGIGLPIVFGPKPMAGLLQSILGKERRNADTPGSNSPVLVGLRCFGLECLATGSKCGYGNKHRECLDNAKRFGHGVLFFRLI